MFRVKTILAAGVAFAIQQTAASAADMPPLSMPPIIESSSPVVEFTSGWYLRGDIGYRFNRLDGAESTLLTPTNNSFNDTFIGGLGAGYKHSWFRADVTVDYAGKNKYQGDGILAGAFTAKVETTTALANVYFDMGTWWGFTPYIGAGAGIAYLRNFDFIAPLGVTSIDSTSKTNFAWAWMAGASYSIAPRWMVDMSYRNLYYGDDVFNPNIANQVTIKDLGAHEVRVGVRYTLD